MDLQNLFTTVLNMTITGSIVISCVLAARFALSKAPRVYAWMLWLVVIFRLLCPVSLSSPVSVLKFVDAPRSGSGAVEYVEMPVQAPLETMLAEPAQLQPGTATEMVPQAPPIDWNLIASRVWLAGLCILTVWSIASYVNLKQKLRESVPLSRGIRESDRIAGPFVLGRTIYLPADVGSEERGYILLHEELHLRHGDPLVKSLFWLAVCVHWFNPLVWLAFALCGRDMELRCDEAVLKKLGGAVRADYAQSLLNFAAGHSRLAAPLAFGEGDTGKRVHFVLNWKKKKLWAGLLAAVLCMAVLVMTGCDPAEQVDGPFGHSYRVSGIISSAQSPVSIDGATVYTLTSDGALFARRDGQTAMYGALKKATPGTPLPQAMPEGTQNVVSPLKNTWKTADGDWWLFQQENGKLRLYDGSQQVLYQLERTDLLGISVKQSGMESYVEPVWYSPDTANRLPEEMSATLVDEEARIVLMPELDVDSILVSEEYYELQPGGETSITTTDYVLEPDAQGNFLLEVSRRGWYGDDFALYRVTVGNENYIFRLGFPMIPGETSVSVHIPEELREVEYAENGAFIRLSIPESWSYAITYTEGAGITFWPTGREEGKLFFGYYPDLFAVCGTGLESTELLLAGQKATAGTYDGRALWDFISFDEHFAVWGQGHESWWAEYGDTAMEILDSAVFGK